MTIEKAEHWRDRAEAAEADLVIANSAMDNLARKLTAAENERDALRAENTQGNRLRGSLRNPR